VTCIEVFFPRRFAGNPAEVLAPMLLEGVLVEIAGGDHDKSPFDLNRFNPFTDDGLESVQTYAFCEPSQAEFEPIQSWCYMKVR
jgi:hypothetical protein